MTSLREAPLLNFDRNSCDKFLLFSSFVLWGKKSVVMLRIELRVFLPHPFRIRKSVNAIYYELLTTSLTVKLSRTCNDGTEGSRSIVVITRKVPVALSPGKNRGSCWILSRAGPKAGLDVFGHEKTPPSGTRTAVLPAQSLVVILTRVPRPPTTSWNKLYVSKHKHKFQTNGGSNGAVCHCDVRAFISCSIGEFIDYWRTEGKRYRVNLLTRYEIWGRDLYGCCMNGTRLLVFIEWLPVTGRGLWSSGRQTRDESREEWSEVHWHTEGHWRIHV
jgi:hypothetical protein